MVKAWLNVTVMAVALGCCAGASAREKLQPKPGLKQQVVDYVQQTGAKWFDYLKNTDPQILVGGAMAVTSIVIMHAVIAHIRGVYAGAHAQAVASLMAGLKEEAQLKVATLAAKLREAKAPAIAVLQAAGAHITAERAAAVAARAAAVEPESYELDVLG